MSTGFKLRKIYRTGYCIGRGAIADRSLGWDKVRFYTRCFLLEHPQKGLILIDTGYGDALIEATQTGLYGIYRRLLPVAYTPEDSVVNQLQLDGISVKDISYLIVTHFHPDHIGALPEFAHTPWIYRVDILDRLMAFSKIRALSHGFIQPLVPPTPKGSIPITLSDFTGSCHSFPSADPFGDASLLLIDLPGHALGQMGVALADACFVADANWGTKALPHHLGFYLQENPKAYRRTFDSVTRIPSSITIFPTHTIEVHNV